MGDLKIIKRSLSYNSRPTITQIYYILLIYCVTFQTLKNLYLNTIDKI